MMERTATWSTCHFQVAVNPFIKARPGGNSFMCKWVCMCILLLVINLTCHCLVVPILLEIKNNGLMWSMRFLRSLSLSFFPSLYFFFNPYWIHLYFRLWCLTFDSVDETIRCDHSNESNLVILETELIIFMYKRFLNFKSSNRTLSPHVIPEIWIAIRALFNYLLWAFSSHWATYSEQSVGWVSKAS